MSQRTPRIVALVCLAILAAILPVSVQAQRRGGRVPPHPPGHFAVRGHVVFVGGYFYDPHFGPYPWWGPGVYPYWYVPVHGVRASVRVIATPKEAAVYVDGFYAGIVDDFDGSFSRCHSRRGDMKSPFSTEIQVHEGETTPLNVALARERP